MPVPSFPPGTPHQGSAAGVPAACTTAVRRVLPGQDFPEHHPQGRNRPALRGGRHQIRARHSALPEGHLLPHAQDRLHQSGFQVSAASDAGPPVDAEDRPDGAGREEAVCVPGPAPAEHPPVPEPVRAHGAAHPAAQASGPAPGKAYPPERRPEHVLYLCPSPTPALQKRALPARLCSTAWRFPIVLKHAFPYRPSLSHEDADCYVCLTGPKKLPAGFF